MIEEAAAQPRGAAPSLRAAHARLLGALAARMAEDRTLVVLGAGDAVPAEARAAAREVVVGPAELTGPVRALDPSSAVVLWLGADPAAPDADGVLRLLGAAVAEGLPAIVEVPGADAAPALTVAGALPGGVVLERRSVEAAVLAPAEDPAAPALPAGTGVVAGRLVCCGLAPDAVREACARAEATAGEVRDAHLQALEEAVEDLRRANVRLAREHLGRHDSAAASVVHRLQSRYEQEREIALENDRLFQEARGRLNTPHHRAADKIALWLKGIPGGSLVSRVMKRLIG